MTEKVWFITGTSRGLGRRIAEAALSRGDSVAATARNTDTLADLIAAYPERALALTLDVTNDSQVADAVAGALARFGHLDVVVNNAGYADLAAIEDTTPSAFRAQIDTNLMGTVSVSQAVLPAMRAQGTGRIINVSSVGSRIATPGLGAYQTAKWAVSGFTEVLASEVAPLGISVTALEPGGMPTDWAGSSMSVPSVSAPYTGTVGIIRDVLASGALTPLADLGKVADAVLSVADLENPPTRLLLGSDALANARGYAEQLAAGDESWRELSRSTDREDATDADRDPLGSLSTSPESVVRRFITEVINGGNSAAIAEIWAEDLKWHGGSLGDIQGLPAYQEFAAANASDAFTGMHLEIGELLTVGNRVVVRFTNSGTQTGTFMGAAPSGVHAEWLGIAIYTVKDGKISEGWFGEDILGMLLQIGAVKL
ncbi:SDR family NAD(P)-dependent oxidoreductase [Mycetocola tolaasinivorans]|uniref:SDR family NAD(P)-dependent oxidoreductase n=1 Tax=Mycetocola tolaasinivorans TaxID=76635 RepID=A0A3L7A8R6_9MICO|nr:SDR family NAD(P)-dependent oxidoreductase [Mycetocola tolaasinivorans]RLP76454.1 SDR family NAD(P)-dependent oxidoreductase [Mycetocola tolaasinivorans]